MRDISRLGWRIYETRAHSGKIFAKRRRPREEKRKKKKKKKKKSSVRFPSPRFIRDFTLVVRLVANKEITDKGS